MSLMMVSLVWVEVRNNPHLVLGVRVKTASLHKTLAVEGGVNCSEPLGELAGQCQLLQAVHPTNDLGDASELFGCHALSSQMMRVPASSIRPMRAPRCCHQRT